MVTWRLINETSELRKWDSQLLQFNDHSIYQTLAWGEQRRMAGWHPYRWAAFDGATLAGAVAATFLRRGTELPAVGSLLVTDEFVASRPIMMQWNAFREKAGVDESLEFARVVQVVRAFVGPVLDTASRGVPFEAAWPPTGPWTEKEMA